MTAAIFLVPLAGSLLIAFEICSGGRNLEKLFKPRRRRLVANAAAALCVAEVR